MRFWHNCHRRGHMISMYSLTGHVHFDHLVKVVSASVPHCEASPFPFVLLSCGPPSPRMDSNTPHLQWTASSRHFGSNTPCPAFPARGCLLLSCPGSDTEFSPFEEVPVTHLLPTSYSRCPPHRWPPSVWARTPHARSCSCLDTLPTLLRLALHTGVASSGTNAGTPPSLCPGSDFSLQAAFPRTSLQPF